MRSALGLAGSLTAGATSLPSAVSRAQCGPSLVPFGRRHRYLSVAPRTHACARRPHEPSRGLNVEFPLRRAGPGPLGDSGAISSRGMAETGSTPPIDPAASAHAHVHTHAAAVPRGVQRRPAGTRAGEERRQKHNAGHEAWAADPAARELTKLIRLCRTPRSLCVLVGARSSHMDYIHVATAFHRLATLIKAGTGAGRQGSRTKRAAKPEVVQWADEHADALALLTGRAVALMDGFQARAVSNVWWACATMAKHAGTPLAPALRDALMRRSLATMDDFAPQTLANTLWSMASLRVAPTPELLAAMALRAPAIAHDFQPQVLRQRTLPPPCCCPDLGLACNRSHSPSELPLARIPTATAGVPAGPFADCMHSDTKATRML